MQNVQPQAQGAVGSLVCGILSIVLLGPFTGIPAIVMGGKARRQVAQSGGALGGDGMALAGVITGWIGSIVFVLTIILAGIVFVLVSNLEKAA